MALTFENSAQQLRYAERRASRTATTVFLIFGFAFLAGSAVFVEILREGLSQLPSQQSSLFWPSLGIAAFVIFGGFCLWLGLLSKTQTIVFDKTGRKITHKMHSLLLGSTTSVYDFNQVQTVEVIERISEEDGPWYTIELTLSAMNPIMMGVMADRMVANTQLQLVREAVGLSSAAQSPFSVQE